MAPTKYGELMFLLLIVKYELGIWGLAHLGGGWYQVWVLGYCLAPGWICG